MDEGITIICSGVLPVALIRDIVCIEPERDAALLSSWVVASAQVEQVIARHAHRIVACSLLASGIAPARHQMQSMQIRQRHIREEGCTQARHIDHLLVVESRRARFVGESANGSH